MLVSSYPAMLANLSPAEMLRQVVELLTSSHKQPERRDLLDELLHMIACKAAIKAGDHLAPEEITALLEQRHLLPGLAPLPAWPADCTRLHARRARPPIQADLTTGL